MRAIFLAGLMAAALGVSACESTGYGYGQAAPQTRLSQCARNALIGAGIGAVIGAATAPDENRAENAAIGAAAGGLGTYGACRYLTAREQQRIENAYYESLSTGQGVNQQWQSEEGPRSLEVERPSPAPGRPDCRRVSARISDAQNGAQSLPAETFCRTPSGQWVPA